MASLDEEPTKTSEDFLVLARRAKEVPDSVDAREWDETRAALVPLAGQIVLDPPSRWLQPTAGTAWIRALHDEKKIAFRLEWDDPTGPGDPGAPDSALVQFAARSESRPYLLFGDPDNPVSVWHWNATGETEEWTARGSGEIEVGESRFDVSARWRDGRWIVAFTREMGARPKFGTNEFVPILLSVRDGAAGERGNVRALSTWLYVTLERPASARPWFAGAAWGLGVLLVLVLVLRKLRP